MGRIEGQDLYEVLQVSPRAHPLVITKAFRLLAALYHPDNQQTGDAEHFKELAQAYRILSDPVTRAAYDRDNSRPAGLADIPPPRVAGDPPSPSARRSVDELELRHLILRALYDVRRGRARTPGLSLLVLAELFNCAIDDLQFSLWYLRGKGLIATTEDSDVAITVEGVDYLEANNLGATTSAQDRAGAISLPLPHAVTVEWSLPDVRCTNGNGVRHTL